MVTTDKEACKILLDVMVAHGVRHAVVSPGSRNAPLIIALSRCERIRKFVIVDERSAAFAALGISQQTGEPVALVCTSGTALLNYAPAVAEAYYQKLPLIVVSADRPKEWIDQDDSQTIRQFEALSRFVKKSYDLPARCSDDTSRWYVNRITNDAMMEATSGRCAPVHINVELDEPLQGTCSYGNMATRIIKMQMPSPSLPDSVVGELVEKAKGKKIMVIAGVNVPDKNLEDALSRLAKLPNAIVLTETISNLTDGSFVRAIDRTLLAMPLGKEGEYKPDLLITVGGAIVSRMVKTFLRNNKVAEHWYVGVADTTVDCMKSLTLRINTSPAVFISQFVDAYERLDDRSNSDFSRMWHLLSESGKSWHADYLKNLEWSDMLAFSMIFSSLPANCRLQLSNGTTIRYAQLFGDNFCNANFCNRGVSGIDGSTSTALGASLVCEDATMLITGDMSFSYDLSGLASQYNSPKLKIIVIDNGGGGIFRFISSTSGLPELEQYFAVERDLPIKKYAEAFGFGFFSAGSEKELQKALPAFFAYKEKAAILVVKTDKQRSAKILKNYFNR